MNTHLDELELAAAVAGLDLAPVAAEHLADCPDCQRSVAATRSLLERRRAVVAAGAPDWDEQRRAVLRRLPAPRARSPWGVPGWRLLLAAAAVVAVAVTATMVRPRATVPFARSPLAVEQILAEVDATLDGAAIPGFAPLAALVPGVDSADELDGFVDNGAPALSPTGGWS